MARRPGSPSSKGHGLPSQAGTSRRRAIRRLMCSSPRGGMNSMLNTIWLVIAALAFGGVVEKAGVLDRLITPIINAANSVGALIISVVSAVLATNIVTADQYMAVVLPARSFKKPFSERGLAPVVLSRAVGPPERQRRHAQLLALRCPISRARCR